MDTKDNAGSLESYLKKTEELKTKAAERKIPEELLKELLYLHSLLDVTRSINTLQNLDRLLELIIDSAVLLTRADRGFLMLFGQDGRLEFKVARNIKKETLDGEDFRISRTLVNQVAASGKSLFLSDIHRDKDFKMTESIVTLGLHMVTCVPLKAKEHFLGLIYLDSRSAAEVFTDVEQKMLEAFAAQASVAIENGYLYESSIIDRLTGLYNYGYLRLRLEKEIHRHIRYKKGDISFYHA